MMFKHRNLLSVGLDVDLLDVCQAQRPAECRAATPPLQQCQECSVQSALHDANMLTFPQKPVGHQGQAGLLVGLVLYGALLCFGTSSHASQTQAVASGQRWDHDTCQAAEPAI